MSVILTHSTAMLAFLRTAETASIAEASRGLDLSASAVSRSIARLEKRLGVRLFLRSTRALGLTPEGTAYYTHVAPLFRALEAAEDSLRPRHELSGMLRVSLPGDLGRVLIHDVIGRFVQAHPGVQLDLDFDDRRVDVLRDGYDLAIRIGALTDSDLTARKLGTLRTVLVAAPGYLAEAGQPADRDALTAHRFVRYIRAGHTQPIGFADGGRLAVKGPLGLNAGFAIRSAALQGLGIAQLLHCTVAADLESGALVEVLPSDLISAMPVTALHPYGRLQPRRLSAFCEYFSQALEAFERPP